MADGQVTVAIKPDTKEYDSAISGLKSKTDSALGGASVLKGVAAWDMLKKAMSIAVNGVKEVINVGKSFEAAMSEVQAISGATADDLERMEAKAREMGATTAFSATQAAEGLKYMALAGWKTDEAIAALPGVLQLAGASGMELGAASDAVTDYMSAFGWGADRATDFADMMVYANNNANTSATQLAAAYGNCATNMAAAGQSAETTTALLMAMADVGMKGSAAGTELNSIMAQLTQKAENGIVTINDVPIKLAEADGSWKNVIDILGEVENAVSGLGEVERSTALGEVFSRQSRTALNTIFMSGMENVTKYYDGLTGDITGTAQRAYDTMTDNLQGDIDIFKSAVQEMELVAYDSFNGVARSATQMGTSMIQAIGEAGKTRGLDGMFEEFINQFTNAAPKVMNAMTKTLTTVVASLKKQLPSIMKGIADNLPEAILGTGNFFASLNSLLIEGFGNAFQSVIETMPQWIPAIGDSLLNVFEQGLTSFTKVGYNLLDSALSAMGFDNINLGNKGLDDAFNNWYENAKKKFGTEVDLGTVNPQINIGEVEMTFSTNAESLAQQLIEKYTDHDASNDAEAKAEFVEGMENTLDAGIAEVEAWRDARLATIAQAAEDGVLGKGEAARLSAEVSQTAETVINAYKTTAQDTEKWAEDMCGEATKTVNDASSAILTMIETLDSYSSEISGIDKKIEESVGNIQQAQADIVKSGNTRDKNTILSVLGGNNEAWKSAIEEVNTDEANEIKRMQNLLGDSYSVDMENLIKERFQKQRDKITELYGEGFTDITDGIFTAFNLNKEDFYGMFDEISLADKLSDGLLDTLNQDADKFRGAFGKFDIEAYKQHIMDEFKENGLTDADLSMFADYLGVDKTAENWQDAVYTALAKGMQNDERFSQLMRPWVQEAAFTFEDMMSLLPDDLQSIVASSIDNGLIDMSGIYDDIGNVDPVKFMQAFFGDGSQYRIPEEEKREFFEQTKNDLEDSRDASGESKIKLPDITALPDNINVDTSDSELVMDFTGKQYEPYQFNELEATVGSLDLDVSDAEANVSGKDHQVDLQDVTAKTHTLSLSDHMNVEASADVDINEAQVTEESNQTIENAAQEAAASVNVQTTANVTADADIEVDTGNAASEGYTDGTEIGSNIARGVAAGISSSQAFVVSRARALAEAAALAIKNAFKIASPSKLMIEYGNYVGQGLGIGIEDMTPSVVHSAHMMARSAINAVEGAAGALNLGSSFGFSGLTDSINDLNDTVAEGNTYTFNVNGRQLATATAADNNQAVNAYSRRIAMGYGRG